MMEIGKALTSSLDLQEILNIIMGKVSELLRAKSWSLLLVDKSTEELYFVIAVSPVADRLKDMRLKPGEGIAGWVALHNEPLLIADAQNDPRFARHVDRRVSFTTRSAICVPLTVKKRVLGVIELINTLDDELFNEADLAILSTIADYAAIAIDNARNYERVCELVITDDLTGLYNARHFNVIIEREVKRAERYQSPLSLLFLDLDHFKQVNDLHGHLIGSRVLAEVGQLIKSHLRETDYAARYGGDEYVILLPETGKEGALTVADHMREVIRSHPFHGEHGASVRVTASFGIASFPEDTRSKRELMMLADQAMYAVKGGSRDGVRAAGV
jgi:diguanylate cyclase (GGDEF)-like protein